MKFYCEWQEEATVRNRCCGWVEAKSEKEAAEMIKNGEVEVIDVNAEDTLDSPLICIDNIYADEEVVD
jgi:hypothetical protein